KDAQVTCCIHPMDFGGVPSNLVDVCSIPSGTPNSDPSDCIVTSQHACSSNSDCDDNNLCTQDLCDSTSGVCVHPPNSSTPVCRASAGDCDVAESCTGSTPDCPVDAFQPSTFECRGSAGECDVAENCTGSTATCPSDALQPATHECRAGNGPCDPAENCTGTS